MPKNIICQQPIKEAIMSTPKKLKRFVLKETDNGPRGGDKQPGHEGGREGSGTRPSGAPAPRPTPTPPPAPPKPR